MKLEQGIIVGTEVMWNFLRGKRALPVEDAVPDIGKGEESGEKVGLFTAKSVGLSNGCRVCHSRSGLLHGKVRIAVNILGGGVIHMITLHLRN